MNQDDALDREAEALIDSLPLDPIWRQAAREVVHEFRYGDTIPKEWLLSHLGITLPKDKLTMTEYQNLSFDMLSKIDALREELLCKYQRYLLNVRGVGYQIVQPPQQTTTAMARLHKEMRRSLAQAMSALVNVNNKALSLDDARENAEARAKVGAFTTLHLKQLEKKTTKDQGE